MYVQLLLENERGRGSFEDTCGEREKGTNETGEDG